jgi:5-methylcytosine-specific restriction endonuclease McrA
MGATVDHLIPVAHGGTDDPRNVALAHRVCNVRRQDKGEVQLRWAA